MRTVAFLHQKGGTGKSTLAIAAAMALAGQGHRVLLLDTDYQGTASDWGAYHGDRHGVAVRSQVQPIVHTEAERFRHNFDWLIVDSPPALSEMTESVLRASDRVVLPLRPALPDVWALPWVAALIHKLHREGEGPEALLLFNQVRDEDLAPLVQEAANWELPVAPQVVPAHPAFQALFSGEPLPTALMALMLASVGASDWPDSDSVT